MRGCPGRRAHLEGMARCSWTCRQGAPCQAIFWPRGHRGPSGRLILTWGRKGYSRVKWSVWTQFSAGKHGELVGGPELCLPSYLADQGPSLPVWQVFPSSPESCPVAADRSWGWGLDKMGLPSLTPPQVTAGLWGLGSTDKAVRV